MFQLEFSRWYLLVGAFVVQFCLGSIYAWSVLNHPIDLAIYGDTTKGRAINTFYIAMGVCGTSMAVFGPLVERKGPRWAVSIGTTLFLAGHIVTGIGCHYKSIIWIYIGYGVITAIGMALCYISPISALQKWFPDYRGTAAGFAVAGAGSGSIVWSKVFLPTIDAVGLAWMFVVLGSVMSLFMYVSLLVLRLPPPSFTVNDLDIHGNSVENDALDEKLESAYIMNQTPKTENATNCAWETGSNTARPSTKQPTLKEAILTPEFALIYIAFFANQLFGVIVLSRLSSMCVDIFSKSENTASDIVSINGAFNCIGRLAFSCTSDLLVRNFKMEKAFARKVLYYYTLGAQIIVIGSLPTVIRHESFTYFAIEIFVLTSSFGGGLGTVPALLTDMFGAYNAGPMQGVILTSVSIGAVGGGIIFNNSLNNIIADGMTVSEAYIDNINAIFIVVCIGFALLFLVRTNVADRLEPGYHYSLCGKRVISIPSKKKSEIKQAEVEEK